MRGAPFIANASQVTDSVGAIFLDSPFVEVTPVVKDLSAFADPSCDAFSAIVIPSRKDLLSAGTEFVCLQAMATQTNPTSFQ